MKQPLLPLQEEERKFGVFFDDDYDYMQHLREKEDLYKDFTDMDEFLSIRKRSDKVNTLKTVLEGGESSEDREGGGRQTTSSCPAPCSPAAWRRTSACSTAPPPVRARSSTGTPTSSRRSTTTTNTRGYVRM